MRKSGFTLIELLVVIAILAILALIGYGVFSGVQGGARDGRRRVEIDQLAKNIESVRDPATGDYLYNDAKGQTDYPDGLSDPSTGNVYCYAVSTANSTPPTNPANFSSSCPSVTWLPIGGSTFTVGIITGVNNDLTETGIKGWKVCAGSERTSSPICKGNTLR